MKKSESSLTSLIAAFSRAYHSQNDTPKIFDDYLAKDLITEQEYNSIQENMVKGIQFFNKDIAEELKGDSEELLKWIVQVQLSPTPLARAAYCENILLKEIKLGVQQYVILGAGLDTFSLRHPELNSTLEIFEIDHPATQEFKKNRLVSANFKLPNNLHFIPMDFTKEFSYLCLTQSGFNNKKTFFSLLGVSYYLTKEEISNLLNHLFVNLPSGSSIVMDYADENLFKEKGISDRVSHMVKMAAASGEPMKSCFTYSEMESLLEKSNLLIYEHVSPKAIQNLYFNKREDYLTAFETIHYIHAVKK